MEVGKRIVYKVSGEALKGKLRINMQALHDLINKNLVGTLYDSKLGNICEEDIIKLAIEYCKSTGKSSFAIGKHKDMLNKGSWQSDPQPHLPKSKNEYKTVYMIGFQYKEFKFIGELLKDYDTKKHKMQVSNQSTYFNEKFGRSDFKEIDEQEKRLGNALAYLMKYIEKSGEKLCILKDYLNFLFQI